jgi:hypothetical protein
MPLAAPCPQLSDYAITLSKHRYAVKDYFPIIGKSSCNAASNCNLSMYNLLINIGFLTFLLAISMNPQETHG